MTRATRALAGVRGTTPRRAHTAHGRAAGSRHGATATAERKPRAAAAVRGRGRAAARRARRRRRRDGKWRRLRRGGCACTHRLWAQTQSPDRKKPPSQEVCAHGGRESPWGARHAPAHPLLAHAVATPPHSDVRARVGATLPATRSAAAALCAAEASKRAHTGRLGDTGHNTPRAAPYPQPTGTRINGSGAAAFIDGR